MKVTLQFNSDEKSYSLEANINAKLPDDIEGLVYFGMACLEISDKICVVVRNKLQDVKELERFTRAFVHIKQEQITNPNWPFDDVLVVDHAPTDNAENNDNSPAN